MKTYKQDVRVATLAPGDDQAAAVRAAEEALRTHRNAVGGRAYVVPRYGSGGQPTHRPTRYDVRVTRYILCALVESGEADMHGVHPDDSGYGHPVYGQVDGVWRQVGLAHCPYPSTPGLHALCGKTLWVGAPGTSASVDVPALPRGHYGPMPAAVEAALAAFAVLSAASE
jgi:hypothetical protein